MKWYIILLNTGRIQSLCSPRRRATNGHSWARPGRLCRNSIIHLVDDDDDDDCLGPTDKVYDRGPSTHDGSRSYPVECQTKAPRLCNTIITKEPPSHPSAIDSFILPATYTGYQRTTSLSKVYSWNNNNSPCVPCPSSLSRSATFPPEEAKCVHFL